MSAQSQNGGYERSDAQMKYINAILLGVGVLTLMGLAVSWAFVKFEDRARAGQPAQLSPLADTLPQQPPEPRLQPQPSRDYRQYKAAQDAVLNSYEIIDEKAGVARIPIERAMELIAERGLPVRGEAKSKGKEVRK
jgi:hypothetical protein